MFKWLYDGAINSLIIFFTKSVRNILQCATSSNGNYKIYVVYFYQSIITKQIIQFLEFKHIL